MKILKIIGGVLAVVIVLGAIAYPLRRDPIAMLAGKELTGTEAAYPSDWTFSDEVNLCAVEVRPDDPHSVTTICFVHDGVLHVPAQSGSDKAWTGMVLDDPRVRVKVGDTIYPARAVRVVLDDLAPIIASAAAKYSQMADRAAEPPPDVWLFRIEPRDG